jgi:sugar lactone lactonase YvrE
VLEIAHNSLLAEGPEGAPIKVDSDGTRSIAIDELFFPGGVALEDDGDLYVTDCGICPTDGEFLHITP